MHDKSKEVACALCALRTVIDAGVFYHCAVYGGRAILAPTCSDLCWEVSKLTCDLTHASHLLRFPNVVFCPIDRMIYTAPLVTLGDFTQLLHDVMWEGGETHICE